MKPLKITTRELERLREQSWEGHRLQNILPDGHREEALAKIDARVREIEGELSGPVAAALKDVNGKAERHTITSYGEVMDIVRRVEQHLIERGVSHAAMAGTDFYFTSEPPNVASYKGLVICTFIKCKRVADGWRLTVIARRSLHSKTPQRPHIMLSDKATNAAIRHAFVWVDNLPESLPVPS